MSQSSTLAITSGEGFSYYHQFGWYYIHNILTIVPSDLPQVAGVVSNLESNPSLNPWG